MIKELLIEESHKDLEIRFWDIWKIVNRHWMQNFAFTIFRVRYNEKKLDNSLAISRLSFRSEKVSKRVGSPGARHFHVNRQQCAFSIKVLRQITDKILVDRLTDLRNGGRVLEIKCSESSRGRSVINSFLFISLSGRESVYIILCNAR